MELHYSKLPPVLVRGKGNTQARNARVTVGSTRVVKPYGPTATRWNDTRVVAGAFSGFPFYSPAALAGGRRPPDGAGAVPLEWPIREKSAPYVICKLQTGQAMENPKGPKLGNGEKGPGKTQGTG